MLQSIYASKLYKTSTRKSRIKAAAESPMNVELVAQLAKSLDEEYKTDDYLMTEKDKAAKAQPAAPQGGEGQGEASGPDFGGSEGGFSGGHPSGGGHFSGGPDFSAGGEDLGGDEGLSGPEAPDEGGAPEPAEKPSDDVKESTRTKGRRVTASSDFKDMGEVANQIKGMLNFKDSTAGVNRTLVKENELWVYFNDDINLNNIMSDVIDTLNGSGYTYLEFNRLARSDNAMVFIINYYSDMIKPLEQIDEKDGVIK